MKKSFRLISIALVALCLSSCDLFKALTKEEYKGYEDYMQNGLKYTKYTDIDAFNNAVDETSYFWTKDDGSTYTCYYTGKSIMIMVYNSQTTTLSFTDSRSVRCEIKDGVTTIRTKNMDDENHVEYKSNTDQKSVVGRADENDLNVLKDSGGYLVVAFQKYMFYITADLQTVYVNEKNTNVFQGYEATKTIPESELLTNTLAALGQDQRIRIPAPAENIEIWYGVDTYKEKKSHGTAYLANVDPNDYTELLKRNGFTVIRSFEDEFYVFYGENGGYWYCYDEKAEIEMYVSMSHYLYTSNLGKTYGPFMNTKVWFNRMKKGYFGERERTTATDWSNSDKSDMAGWYDGTIDATKVPFPQLSKAYRVPSAGLMSYAHEGLMDGTLTYHHKCYNICDDSPNYYLDGYNEALEAAGFRKYVPQYDLTIAEQRTAYFNTEESKYIECFINQEEDIAVKYYFDIINGNTVRIFKLSEMKSWLQDSDEK